MTLPDPDFAARVAPIPVEPLPYMPEDAAAPYRFVRLAGAAAGAEALMRLLGDALQVAASSYYATGVLGGLNAGQIMLGIGVAAVLLNTVIVLLAVGCLRRSVGAANALVIAEVIASAMTLVSLVASVASVYGRGAGPPLRAYYVYFYPFYTAARAWVFQGTILALLLYPRYSSRAA